MSDLYKEALLDGRKLKEIAEAEAKKQLLEKFTPFVKDMISKELKVKSSNLFEQTDLKEKAFVVGEQEEDPNALPPPPPPVTDPTGMPPVDAAGSPSSAPLAQDPAAVAATPPVDMAPPSDNLDSGAPLEPVGANDLGSTTLDQLGDDGKITVDVNDLFSPAAPEAVSQTDEVMAGVAAPEDATPPSETSGDEPIASPEEMGEVPPPPAPPVEEPVVQEQQVIASINEAAYKIDIFCLKEGNVKDLEKNYHKQRLFSLLEQVDNLKEKGLISGKQAKILENKLEFLFIKLKEANLANSYKKTITREDTDNMASKSLKSIAAQLFQEEVDPIGKTQTAADNRSKSASQHAKDASGNPKGYDADSEDSVPTKEKETFWDEQDPNGEGLLENYEAGDETVDASTGFGDEGSEEPEVEFEVSEAELMEAIKQLRKENVKRKNKAIKESMGMEEECGSPMGEQAELGEDTLELGSSDDDDMGGDDDSFGGFDAEGGVDVASAEQDLQAAFEALGITDVNVSLGQGGSDDDEIEIVDDGGDDMGSDESGMMMHDGDEDEAIAAEMALYEASLRKKYASKKTELNESVQVKAMKKEIDENNLFTAKTVFLNKILMRENMSKSTTRKVVELLDKARTLAEAKEIYQKILARLNEGKVASSNKLAGSSASRATSAGSTKSLNESVTRTQQTQDSSVERWQVLAGIKKSTKE